MQNLPFTIINSNWYSANSKGQLIVDILLQFPFDCFDLCRNEGGEDLFSTTLNNALISNLTYNDGFVTYRVLSITPFSSSVPAPREYTDMIFIA